MVGGGEGVDNKRRTKKYFTIISYYIVFNGSDHNLCTAIEQLRFAETEERSKELRLRRLAGKTAKENKMASDLTAANVNLHQIAEQKGPP